jgi:hypothetical protein
VGELFDGSDVAVAAATAVASRGFVWTCESVKVWQRGEVAWARILGTVLVSRDGVDDLVPYWTSGVFGRENDGWVWLHWGGAEPQDPARV